MSKWEWFLIFGIVCIFTSLSYAVIKTAKENTEVYYQKIEQKKEDRRQEDIRVRCAVYYNDGTGRWKECMGVGYK